MFGKLTSSTFLVAHYSLRQRHIYMIMDLATGGELFNLVTRNPGDCATEPEIKRMLINMLSAVWITKNGFGPDTCLQHDLGCTDME